MKRRITASIALVVALGALTACGSSSDGESPSTTSGAGTASAPSGTSESNTAAPSGSAEADASATPEADEAPFPADASPDTGQASAGAQLVLIDVRSATHDGYDRVVLEFSGPGTPGWMAQYADEASRQGIGGPITVDGAALIDIQVTGSAIPKEGDPTVAAGPIPTSGTSVVTDIFNDGTFEGVTHLVIGISEQKPFRVFTVADPARVVIDVQK